MSSNSSLMNAVQLIGRILFSYIFITAGYAKLMSHDGSLGYIASAGMPIPAEIAYWAAVAVELGCGVLVLVGFLARPAALAIGVFTLAAGYYFHLPYANGTEMINVLQKIHFNKNICIAGAAFFIAASGAGGWSLDAKIFGGRG